MKKIIKKIIRITFLILFIIFVVIPYIKVEILTYRYGAQFKNEYQQTTMISYVDYFKVMEYSSDDASVYYIAHGSDGELIRFHNENGQWIMVSWKTIWSTSGSADSFIWPYYR